MKSPIIATVAFLLATTFGLNSCAKPSSSFLTGKARPSYLRSSATFTVGSSEEQVRAIMGRPDSQRKSSDGMTWAYGFSHVVFRSGRVSGWENHGNNLKTSGEGDQRVVSDEPRSRPLEGGGSVPTGAIVHGVGGSRAAVSSGSTNPDVIRINDYTRSDGTRVQGHYRTRGNGTARDNFGSSGNVNPFTREPGYR